MLNARVISDECVSCGACEDRCPEGAISVGPDHMEIDANKCAACGMCQPACPVGAISEL